MRTTDKGVAIPHAARVHGQKPQQRIVTQHCARIAPPTTQVEFVLWLVRIAATATAAVAMAMSPIPVAMTVPARGLPLGGSKCTSVGVHCRGARHAVVKRNGISRVRRGWDGGEARRSQRRRRRRRCDRGDIVKRSRVTGFRLFQLAHFPRQFLLVQGVRLIDQFARAVVAIVALKPAGVGQIHGM